MEGQNQNQSQQPMKPVVAPAKEVVTNIQSNAKQKIEELRVKNPTMLGFIFGILGAVGFWIVAKTIGAVSG